MRSPAVGSVGFVPLVALVALVLTTGCLGGLPVPDSGGSIGARPNASVTVTHVVDGDTVDVRFADGHTDRVRLLGVDTPETHVANTPDEYEGVPNTSTGRACLRSAGVEASRWLTTRVEGRTATLVFDPMADRRGDYGRLLAYLYANGTDLDYQLVATGRGRVYDSPFVHHAAYREAEAAARAAHRGLWTCAG